jgi:alpha-galactosidase
MTSIEVVNDDNVFHLRGDASSYAFRVTNHGHLEHVHWGPALPDAQDLDSVRVKQPAGSYGVAYDPSDEAYNLDLVPLEWSGMGKGDYREPGAELKMPDGSFVTDFTFVGYELREGALPPEDGLPGATANDRPCETLIIHLADGSVRLDLIYTVFPTVDVVTRRAVLSNDADTPVVIRRLLSQQVDLPNLGYDLVTFDGSWITEANKHVRPVAPGLYVNSSSTGWSSNRHNPGVLLARRGTTEDRGEVYAFNLIYTGNHYTAVELSQRELVRVASGINPTGFEWTLPPGQRFETPEAVLSWSRDGFNGASANLHAFVGTNIVRGEWAEKERPVLMNNWEATFFDFDHAKVMSFAKVAKRLGAELFVLDDGWFGARNNDSAGLGDYGVNTKKLPKGLEGLSADVKALGMKFGLWFEPEMVNRDSELFRAHPDWIVSVPGRQPSEGRHQLVLDLSRAEVRDYIVENVGRILDTAGVDYVKWDCNRLMSDVGSAAWPSGEVAHRFILGLYDVLHRIFGPRPHILFESCASGGCRFDLGMLCYSPQIWASDDTDPIERLKIQVGLSYLYPQSTMGSHVTASPSMQTLRDTPLTTRFNVAATGCLGYELDPRDLNPAEQGEVSSQIAWYIEHRRTLQFGRFSRHDNGRDNQITLAMEGEDETIVGHYQTTAIAGQPPEWLPIPGLDPMRRYRVSSKPQSLAIKDFGHLINQVSPVHVNSAGLIAMAANKFRRVPDAAEVYEGSGAALSRLQLTGQFNSNALTPETRLLGDHGSTLYLVEPVAEGLEPTVAEADRVASA